MSEAGLRLFKFSGNVCAIILVAFLVNAYGWWAVAFLPLQVLIGMGHYAERDLQLLRGGIRAIPIPEPPTDKEQA